MNTIADIKFTFNGSIATNVSNFSKRVSQLVDPIIADMKRVQLDPSTATDVFDKSITAFTVGIGDQNTGIYGLFISDITSTMNAFNIAINYYADNVVLYTEVDAARVQSEIAVLSDYVSKSSASAVDNVSSIVSSYNTKFTSALTYAQNKAAEFFIRSCIDSFIGAVFRAETHARESVNRLVEIYKSYGNTLPSGFYTDVNTILTEIGTAFNDEVAAANIKYNDLIAGYKYYTTESQSQMEAGSVRISSAISASSSRVSASFDVIPVTLYNKSDYIFAQSIAKLCLKLFDESIRVHNNLDNLVSNLSKRAELTLKSISRYYKNSYKPIYVDGAQYRNSRSQLTNAVEKMVYDDVSKLITDYNDGTSVISANYTTYLSTVHSDIIDYINSTVQNITEDQITIIGNMLSAAISRYNYTLTGHFSYYMRVFDNMTDGIVAQKKRLLEKYYLHPPLIRFTGPVTIPALISNVDSHIADDGHTVIMHNVFTFEVTNLGHVAWTGWFGIKLTSDTAVFLWNRRAGYDVLSPGESRMFTVIVPGSQIYNYFEFGPRIVPTVVVNTYSGVSKSLQKN